MFLLFIKNQISLSSSFSNKPTTVVFESFVLWKNRSMFILYILRSVLKPQASNEHLCSNSSLSRQSDKTFHLDSKDWFASRWVQLEACNKMLCFVFCNKLRMIAKCVRCHKKLAIRIQFLKILYFSQKHFLSSSLKT